MKVHDELANEGVDRVDRSVVRLGSSVDLFAGRSGTRESVGWIVVIFFFDVWGFLGGEFDGPRSGANTLVAWALKPFTSSNGDGAGFVLGQDITYPASLSAGWMSKLKLHTPVWILWK